MNLLCQVPPSNPVLILATSHCRPAELPPLLISFFSTSSAVGNQRHAADSVIILEDELPVRELHPAETSIEHLLQRRKATACSSGITAKDVPAVKKENAASAGPLVSLPVFNAAERERGQQILQQVCHSSSTINTSSSAICPRYFRRYFRRHEFLTCFRSAGGGWDSVVWSGPREEVQRNFSKDPSVG